VTGLGLYDLVCLSLRLTISAFSLLQEQQLNGDVSQALHSVYVAATLSSDDEICSTAALAFATAMGIDPVTKRPTGPDGCAVKAGQVWRVSSRRLPTQAGIQDWCLGCALSLKASISEVMTVRTFKRTCRSSNWTTYVHVCMLQMRNRAPAESFSACAV